MVDFHKFKVYLSGISTQGLGYAQTGYGTAVLMMIAYSGAFLFRNKAQSQ
jgi:hypothetical protein